MNKAKVIAWQPLPEPYKESDLYIEARLQAIKDIASASCADEKDADNIASFCDEIYSAIEIVKQGGVYDDSCEWRCDAYERWHTKCHILSDNDPLEYTYCPYCSKKIKVVEQMADITNKNELKRRIELFLDELDYSINEDFCKETMKMMREFIGHASHRLDCEESRVKSLKKKLKEYKDLEKQGLLLRLPLKIEDKVYSVTRDFISEYTICSIEKYNEGFFFNWKCEKGIYINVRGFTEYDIGKTVFLTKAEAERKLKEMESK